MKNRYSELFSNTLIFACATLGSKLVMFFLLPLYTNIMSPAEYGIVELIITGINLLTPLLTLSFSDAVLRFGLDNSIPHGKVLKVTLRFLSGSSAIMIICTPLVRLYPPLRDYAWIFTATLIVFMYRSNITFYLKIIDRNQMFAVDTILYTILLAAFNILFLLRLKMGVEGYMLSLILANLASILFCCIVGKIPQTVGRTVFDFLLLRNMLIYSIPLVINALSWWVINSSDKYMLEYFYSTSEVGIYSAASKIPALLNAVNSLFYQAWTISSVKEYDTNADKVFFSNIFHMFSALMIFASSCILLILKPFMNIYVGSEFLEAWKYVSMLLIASLFSCLSSFFGSIYIATRQNIRCTISSMICSITNIVMNLLLIPRFGIMGAAAATAAAYAVIAVYRMLDCQRTFSFKINYLQHGIAVLAVIAQAVLIVVSPHRIAASLMILACLSLIYKNDFKKVHALGSVLINKVRHR